MSISFKIHYVTVPDQILFVVFEDGGEIPLTWTEGNDWVGSFDYESPKDYTWHYVVRSFDSGKKLREEEIIGTREHHFISKAQVRDWWFYPWLTEIEEDAIEKEVEGKFKNEQDEQRKRDEDERLRNEERKRMEEENARKFCEIKTPSPTPEEEKKKEKETKIRLCGSETNWDLFKMWTGKACYQILYDSTVDDFTAKAFNECVEGNNCVIVFIHSQGYIFGSYTSVTIPKIGNSGAVVQNDSKSFAFSFLNPYGHAAIRYMCEETKETLKLFSNEDEENVVLVNNFFTIKQQKDKCVISPNFERSYNETSGRGALMFVRAVEPETFTVDKLFAVKLTFNKNR